ncbi:hypothetical protein H9P43_004140 [Blastocladiella emersonii ATCC 22665]|nr:hypothetical protein H9P43_004140 [Blastocladiella emersonii ATCC 22665]
MERIAWPPPRRAAGPTEFGSSRDRDSWRRDSATGANNDDSTSFSSFERRATAFRHWASPSPSPSPSSSATDMNGTASKASPCNFFNKTGWCKFGDNCRYSHDSSLVELEPGKKLKQQCVHFVRGNCRYGDRCHFSHDVAPSSSSSITSSSSASPKSTVRTIGDIADAARDVIRASTTAENPGRLYVMPSLAPSSWLVADADLRPFGLADLDGQRAAKFLAELLRQLDDDPAGLLLALDPDCRVLRALRELACHDDYSADLYLVGGKSLSFQSVLLPLLYVLSHRALGVSALCDKVALVRDAVADATANLVHQFLKCARAALNTRSLVAPMALESDDDVASATFQPFSFAQAFAPMLKYLELVAACDPEPAELNVVRTALKKIEGLVDTWEPLVDMEGDDAFAAIESPRAVELVCELLAKAKRPLAAAVSLADQLKAQLELNKQAAATRSSMTLSAHSPSMVIPACRPSGAHDNDEEDYRHIAIVPTMAEIMCDDPPTLPGNLQFDSEAHWLPPGPQRLLDTHFRLLRHDMMGTIKGGVRLFLNHLNGGKSMPHGGRFEHNTESLSADLMVYAGVKPDKSNMFAVDSRAGLLFNVRFDRPRSLGLADLKDKCLQWGNLVFIVYPVSPDGPYTAEFATVTHRESLERGLVGLSFLAEGVPGRLAFSMHQSLAVQRRPIPPVYLAEFRDFLFESYRPILESLQGTAPWSLPFADVICPPSPPRVLGEGTRVPPYAQLDGFTFDLSFLAVRPDAPPIIFAPASPGSLNRTMALLAEHSELDASQATALLQALSTDVCCIQGAPGAGKSRVGISIARAIIGAVEHDSDFSILVMCHTNHALDQFLLGLVNAGFENLVRVGSGVSDELNEFRPRQSADGFGRRLKDAYESLEQEGSTLIEALADALDDPVDPARGAMQRSLLHIWNSIGSRRFRDCDSFTVWFHGYDLGARGLQHVVPLHRRPEHLRHPPKFELVVGAGPHRQDAPPSPTNVPRAAVLEQRRAPRELAELLLSNDAWSMTKEERRIVADHLRVTDPDYFNTDDVERATALCNDVLSELKQLRHAREVRSACRALVIGMTTTGAAARPHLLRGLSPEVIICEEAGEILEAHTLAAMHPSLQHLILIGDHKQLRPKINNHDLSVQSRPGRGYRLDVSMFERLIVPEQPDLVPALGHVQLQHQRRMKPIISQFIRRGGIYPELMDGANTLGRPAVRGMTKEVFFMAHSQPQLVASDGLSLGSHSNEFEAEMAVELVDHLLRQGYADNQIVIITPYIGQLALINKAMAKWRLEARIGDRDRHDLLRFGGDGDNDGAAAAPAAPTKLGKATIRVACVDAYQGEEADIIIISLVRSFLRDGSDRGIGFLKVANRVNVMMSRAKLGMYLIGNAALLEAKSDLWATLLDVMREQDLIGPAFEIGCPNHHDTRLINNPAGFRLHAPDGGCTLPCGATFDCGHVCRRRCHGDDHDHAAVVCREPVDAVALPRCSHEYAPLCSETADLDSLKCSATVEHVFSCGHSITLSCRRAAAGGLDTLECSELIHHDLPCGHSQSVSCIRLAAGDVPNCTVAIDWTPSCGHAVKIPCHHLAGKTGASLAIAVHLYFAANHIKCDALVERARRCGHLVTVPCHADVDGYAGLCRVTVDPIALPHCGHEFTPYCFQLGGLNKVKCAALVEKSRSCGHALAAACHADADQLRCTWRCSATLDCAHVCGSNTPERSYITDCDRHLRHRQHAPSASSSVDSTVSSLCPPCTATSTPRCDHDHDREPSTCGEPRAPCAVAPCAWTACSHGIGACEMPCSAPCTRIPCDSRCELVLSCGHRCPSICGETCPDVTFCQQCASIEVRAQQIDSGDVDDTQYRELDLDAQPIVALSCGHVVPVDLLDDHVGLNHYYARSGIRPIDADVGELRPSPTCPICATPVHLAHFRRYGRIFKAGAVDDYDDLQLRELADKVMLAPKSHISESVRRFQQPRKLTEWELDQLNLVVEELESHPSRQLHLACLREYAAAAARGEPVDTWATLKYEEIYARALFDRGVLNSRLFAHMTLEDPAAAEFYFDDACVALIRANELALYSEDAPLALKSTLAWLELQEDYIAAHARSLQAEPHGKPSIASPAQLSCLELLDLHERILHRTVLFVARLVNETVPDELIEDAHGLKKRLVRLERPLLALDAGDAAPVPPAV